MDLRDAERVLHRRDPHQPPGHPGVREHPIHALGDARAHTEEQQNNYVTQAYASTQSQLEDAGGLLVQALLADLSLAAEVLDRCRLGSSATTGAWTSPWVSTW